MTKTVINFDSYLLSALSPVQSCVNTLTVNSSQKYRYPLVYPYSELIHQLLPAFTSAVDSQSTWSFYLSHFSPISKYSFSFPEQLCLPPYFNAWLDFCCYLYFKLLLVITLLQFSFSFNRIFYFSMNINSFLI